MRILSNSFPTNMPDSEKISQGGPANFAKQFTNYITSHSKHNWIGLIFDTSPIKTIKSQKVYSFKQRDYYKMTVPSGLIKAITATNIKKDPKAVMDKLIKKIAALIKIVKPDVIFLNGYGIFNWALLKAGEISKVPVVIQHAGIWTKELRIHSRLYSKRGRVLMENMEKDSTKIAAHEIFLNEWSKKYYHENVAKVDSKKTSVVPLPFDFSSFKKMGTVDANLFNFNNKQIHFGVIARWDEIKNHKAILAMAKKAKKENLNWIFHSVVDIPDRYAKEKKEYCKHVDVIPPLDRSGIYQFCKAVDVLILPSLFDVSPTVVLEAFASNTPIIISPNVGFGHEFKIYGGKKWIVDFSNMDLAIKKVKKIIGKKMPKLLVKKIYQNHESKKVFTKYLEIFKSCVF